MKLKAVAVTSVKRMKNQVKVKHQVLKKDGKVKEKCVLLSTVTTTNKPASYLFSGSRKTMPGILDKTNKCSPNISLRITLFNIYNLLRLLFFIIFIFIFYCYTIEICYCACYMYVQYCLIL